jgi:2-C-methyl-D-erythritol 4-phosphate cytidylyltransferase
MSSPFAPVHALVPCAGVGARSGAAQPKQYTVVAGQSVVARTLSVLLSVQRIQTVTVVVAPHDGGQFEDAVPQALAKRVRLRRLGGDTRAESVLAGLNDLVAQGAADNDWVLVHDAARCLVSPGAIGRLIEACTPDAVGGLLALPVSDTLKRSIDTRSQGTIERQDKWTAQTPQMFRLALLRHALVCAGQTATDEASAVEAQGLHPLLVRGEIMNLKITWPEDFDVACRWLATEPGNAPR